MSLLQFELSRQDGRPVELFLFKTPLESVGTGFTNNDTAITYINETYQPIAIARTSPRYDQEKGADAIELSVPEDLDFVRRWVPAAPPDRYVVTVYRRQLVDGASPETVTWWKGFIADVTFDDSPDAIIRCESLFSLASAFGPRMTFQSSCNHYLYDGRCTLIETGFRRQAVLTAISVDGLTLTVPGINTSAPVTAAPAPYQATYWVGGFVRTPNNVDHRTIVEQIGSDQVKVDFPFYETPTGLNLSFFAGCDHQILTCRDKFNNLPNFGGHPYIPVRNIFTKGLSR